MPTQNTEETLKPWYPWRLRMTKFVTGFSRNTLRGLTKNMFT